MTRHNLNCHISWLLSSKVTPPLGVHTSFSRDPAAGVETEDPIILEDEYEGGISRPTSISSQTRPETTTVITAFARPDLPPGNNPEVTESSYTPGKQSVAKVASTSRSGLMAQYQLATPASTSNSTAAPSSLTQSYANQLRKTTGKA